MVHLSVGACCECPLSVGACCDCILSVGASCCCNRAFSASRALSSPVLALPSATFRHAVSMSSGFAASAWAFISASFCALS